MILDAFKQRLPRIYMRKEKACYLDPVRKKLIYVTPEETVRQQVLSYLTETLHVPAEMIGTEVHLSHYGVSSHRRADIVVHGLHDDTSMMPLAIIECKAPGVVLGDAAAQQLADYCNALIRDMYRSQRKQGGAS